MTTPDPIGAFVQVEYEDGDTLQGYISFEDFPENAPEDDYILPLSGIRDDQVMFYIDYPEFIKMIETIDITPDIGFVIKEYKLITSTCE